MKNLSRLLSSQASKHDGKKFYCLRCLQHFTTEQGLIKHSIHCSDFELLVPNFKSEQKARLSFNKRECKENLPLVLYADFESILESRFKAD